MKLPPSPLALGLAAIAVLSPNLFSQTQYADPTLYGNPIDRVYHHGLTDTTTTQVVTGELTDDRVVDVLAIMGGQPVIMAGPAYTTVRVQLDLPSGHSAVTAVTAKKISDFRYSAAIGSSLTSLCYWLRTDSTGDYAPVVIPGTASWAGAKQLLVADVHPAYGEELIGLFDGPNGNCTIRVARFDSFGFVPKGSFTVAGDAISMHILDREPNFPKLQMAVLSPAGVNYFVHQGGSNYLAFDLNYWSDNATCAAAFEDARGAGLAVAHTMSNGQSSLGVYRANGPEALIALNAGLVHEMASAPAVASQWMDLVTVSTVVKVAKNKSHLRGASFQTYSTYPTSKLPSQLTGLPLTGLAVADFDGDGDADIYVQEEHAPGSADEAFAHMNPFKKPGDFAPMVKRPSFAVPADKIQVQAGVEANTVDLGARVYNLQEVVNAGATHLDVELWAPGKGTDIVRFRSPIPMNSNSNVDSESFDFDVNLELTGVHMTGDAESVFFVRGVTLQADGISIDTAGPAMRYGLNMQAVQVILGNGSGLGIIPGNEDPPPPKGDDTGTPGTP